MCQRKGTVADPKLVARDAHTEHLALPQVAISFSARRLMLTKQIICG